MDRRAEAGYKVIMNTPRIESFFDGDCPLCLREVNLLRRLDRRGHILFTDIAAPDFRVAEGGPSHASLMERMHGRLPDGSWIEGVEVFRQMYAAVGFGPLVALSRLPGLFGLLDLGYLLFARNRLRLTGRCVDGACAIGDAR